MDEHADTPPAEQMGDPLRQRPPGLDGLARALGRAAPVLRQVVGDSVADEMREAVVARAGGLIDRAHDAVARFTAIEGAVVDGDQRAGAGAAKPAPNGAAAPAGPASAGAVPRPGTSAAGSGARAGVMRDPHWTAQRVARMASAAGREALRPAPGWRPVRPVLLGAAAVVVSLVLLLRRRP